MDALIFAHLCGLVLIGLLELCAWAKSENLNLNLERK